MKSVTEYMTQLHKQLQEVRGVTDQTASQYIRSLYSLNNNRPFTNLAWLKNKASVEQRLSEFAESTQKTLLSVIVASLSLVKDKTTYKKIHSHYYNLMMGKVKEENGKDTSIMSEKQSENWLSWDVVKAHMDRLTEEMKALPEGSKLTPGQWETCLSFMLLSLYTEFEPRRNQDYQYMYVNKNEGKQSDSDKVNYLILDTKEFIFRKYKTAKTHGEQRFPIPPALFKNIELYLSHHPIWNVVKGKKITSKMGFPFLATHDGSPLLAVNSITRILNKIFGKRVGSTMLRHIYLSNKYDVKEMNETAEKMGHTGAVQREYLKTEDVQEVTVPMAEKKSQ
jgi:hypothetical protein